MSYYIIIRGPLGCGKSTISKALAKKINGRHVSIDLVLDKQWLIEDKEDGYISQKSFKKANEIACKDAIQLLQSGTPIIFDGNFYWKSQVDDLIKRLDFPHHVFTLNAPLDVCIARDSKRNVPHGEVAAKVVHKKATEFDYGIIIDITRPLNDCIEDIMLYLPTT